MFTQFNLVIVKQTCVLYMGSVSWLWFFQILHISCVSIFCVVLHPISYFCEQPCALMKKDANLLCSWLKPWPDRIVLEWFLVMCVLLFSSILSSIGGAVGVNKSWIIVRKWCRLRLCPMHVCLQCSEYWSMKIKMCSHVLHLMVLFLTWQSSFLYIKQKTNKTDKHVE